MKTIMIIEDMPDLQLLFRIFVEKLGYMVLTADNGEAAEQQLNCLKEKPVLILCDMMMPGDGWEFIEKISRHHIMVTIPVVAMPAAHVIGSSVPNHARSFIKKPFSLDSLAAIIKECT